MTPGGECGATVRPAVPEDLAAVVRLDRDCFGEGAWSAASWSDEFDRLGDTRLILVAASDDEQAASVVGEGAVSLSGDERALVTGVPVVGFVVVAVPDHPDDPVDLMRIAVTPAWRRTGVAGRLMEAALPADRTVLLEVAEGNQAARRLYERYGFTEISRRKGYYPGGEDAVILQRIR